MMKGIKKELILVTLPVYLNVTDLKLLDILHKASVLTDSSMFLWNKLAWSFRSNLLHTHSKNMEEREMYAKIYSSLFWLYHELWHTKTLNTSHEANKKICAGVKKGEFKEIQHIGFNYNNLIYLLFKGAYGLTYFV